MPSRRALVSPEEWQMRVDLRCRLVALSSGTTSCSPISARVPGPHEHFLINPYGLMFEEITASSLIKIDLKRATRSKTRRIR
jgi:ribulose-5-phosphate 4-epimerase/fuculose-1-phosphate aldolase